MADDTGWKPITIEGGDGETEARGRIELEQGTEPHPCMMCKSFEKDAHESPDPRILRYFIKRGMTVLPDGRITTPIAKDIPGRKPLVIDPKNFGFCRRDGIPVDIMATCERWCQKATSGDFQTRR